MSIPELRPRFQTLVPCRPEKAFEKFRLRLQQPQCPFEGTALDTFVSLTVKAEDRHYWSPVLTVQSRATEEGTRLQGHYGPHPNVWTLLLALSAIFCFGGVFIAMYGCAQLLLGQTPWALLGIPGAALGIALVYGLSLVGQWRAHDQMLQLKSFFDLSLCAQDLDVIEASAPPEKRSAKSDHDCAECRKRGKGFRRAEVTS